MTCNLEWKKYIVKESMLMDELDIHLRAIMGEEECSLAILRTWFTFLVV